MFKRLIVMFVVLCVITILSAAKVELSGGSTPVEPKDLVTIKVNGTIIDLLPKHIDVITLSPTDGVKKLVASVRRRPPERHID